MPLAVAVALKLPALSLQVPEADCPAPSDVNVFVAVQKSMPDKASVPLNVTLTVPLFQPLLFESGVALAIAVGGVLSMLMPVCVSDTEFPAKSMQVPVADWPEPSVVSTCLTLDD